MKWETDVETVCYWMFFEITAYRVRGLKREFKLFFEGMLS